MQKTVVCWAIVATFMTSAMTAYAEADKPGKLVYKNWCLGCHADSPFAPGTIYLRTVRTEGLAVVADREGLPAEYISMLVRKGQGGMPSFRKTEITDNELELLIQYLSDG